MPGLSRTRVGCVYFFLKQPSSEAKEGRVPRGRGSLVFIEKSTLSRAALISGDDLQSFLYCLEQRCLDPVFWGLVLFVGGLNKKKCGLCFCWGYFVPGSPETHSATPGGPGLGSQPSQVARGRLRGLGPAEILRDRWRFS
jgi:hypothetical protein